MASKAGLELCAPQDSEKLRCFFTSKIVRRAISRRCLDNSEVDFGGDMLPYNEGEIWCSRPAKISPSLMQKLVLYPRRVYFTKFSNRLINARQISGFANFMNDLGLRFSFDRIRLNVPKLRDFTSEVAFHSKLECGPMPNVMVALPNIGGALCSTPQSLADAHY